MPAGPTTARFVKTDVDDDVDHGYVTHDHCDASAASVIFVFNWSPVIDVTPAVFRMAVTVWFTKLQTGTTGSHIRGTKASERTNIWHIPRIGAMRNVDSVRLIHEDIEATVQLVPATATMIRHDKG